LYLLSAVGMEIVSNVTVERTTPYHLTVLLEETGEMLGATFMLWAAWGLLVCNGLRVNLQRDAGPAGFSD
jgi:hypothetical protein